MNRLPLMHARAPLIFSLHTTAAALAALVLAGLAGLHHPWWAAMTVWLVAQPTRGLLVERCIARLAGTAAGALVGGSLLYFFFDSPKVLLTLLAIWLVLCAGIGNLFRHFRHYAWVLAGYSAAIVSLFGLADPVLDPELATGRIVCTVIGILCSFGVSWLFTPASAPAIRLEKQLEKLLTDSIRWCMSAPSHMATESDVDFSRLLGMAKSLDTSLDMAAAGSRSGKNQALRARQTVDALIVVLAVIHRQVENRQTGAWDIEFNNGRTGQENLEALLEWLKRTYRQSPEYQQCLTALSALHDVLHGNGKPVSIWSRAIDHDWRAACTSAVRPLSALTLTALVWQLTDWSEGPIMAMTSVLFASLLSSHTDARTAVRDVFTGSLLGAGAGLIARLWLTPYSDNYALLLLSITPFLLAGAFLMARPRTAKMAIDLNMTFLLISQPGAHMNSDLASLLSQTLAILLGVMAAAASLLLWQQAHPRTRRLALARRIARQTRKATSPARLASAHAKTRQLLVSLVSLEGASSELVKAAFACLAATAPCGSKDILQAPKILKQKSHEARASADRLAALATHVSP